MKITYELLQEREACGDGFNWFKDNFHEGCELCEETIAKLEDAPTELIWWFYNNVQQDKRLYKLCGVNESYGILNLYGVDNALLLADKLST